MIVAVSIAGYLVIGCVVAAVISRVQGDDDPGLLGVLAVGWPISLFGVLIWSIGKVAGRLAWRRG